MLSFPAAAATVTVSSSSISSSLAFLRGNSRARVSKSLFSSSSSSSSPRNLDPHPSPPPRSNHAGFRLEETVDSGSNKSRLDAWISSRIEGVSRARIQSSIRSGLVSVNGRIIDKVSHIVKGGDLISCTVSELKPLRAEAEDIPLDIVYEDEHVLVVNKPAHMVVHPAPGNVNGTLVNAVLHHCRLPTFTCVKNNMMADMDSSDEEIDALHVDQLSAEISPGFHDALVRPGIVHRLDKGTSGLLVVAKDEHAHAQLAEQFKLHTINRVYVSLTSGVPNPNAARVEIPIARDPNNRTRMVAVSASSHRHARDAASRYEVIEVLAGGGSALVEWRLETGRTHQIRAHAKYLGIPLLGDEVYGGTKSMALSLLKPRTPSRYHGHISSLISKLERPCLHALSLGFKHPHTGEFLQFSCPPPNDFSEVLDQLRNITRS